MQQVDFLDYVLGDSFALLLAYWIVVALAHGVAYYQRYHERLTEVSRGVFFYSRAHAMRRAITQPAAIRPAHASAARER